MAADRIPAEPRSLQIKERITVGYHAALPAELTGKVHDPRPRVRGDNISSVVPCESISIRKRDANASQFG